VRHRYWICEWISVSDNIHGVSQKPQNYATVFLNKNQRLWPVVKQDSYCKKNSTGSTD